jgi:lactoylglutathione lyase
MFRRIDHVALHVGDIDQSAAFYETHFGFEKYFENLSSRGGRIAYLKLGDTVLELVDQGGGPMSGFHFCLETDDFDAAVDGLTRAGVELERAPHDTAARVPREEGWRRVVFRGPDGESIELRG